MTDADPDENDRTDEATETDPDGDDQFQDSDGETPEQTAHADDEDTEMPEPTAQSQALRRQQFYVGACGGIIAGLALMAGLFQQFPGLPTPAVVLAGVLSMAAVLWLVKKSVFPGEAELTET